MRLKCLSVVTCAHTSFHSFCSIIAAETHFEHDPWQNPSTWCIFQIFPASPCSLIHCPLVLLSAGQRLGFQYRAWLLFEALLRHWRASLDAASLSFGTSAAFAGGEKKPIETRSKYDQIWKNFERNWKDMLWKHLPLGGLDILLRPWFALWALADHIVMGGLKSGNMSKQTCRGTCGILLHASWHLSALPMRLILDFKTFRHGCSSNLISCHRQLFVSWSMPLLVFVWLLVLLADEACVFWLG